MRNTMNVLVVLVVSVLVLIALGLLAFAVFRNSRGQRLRRQFGPEYDRAIQETGSRQAAEDRLAERVEQRRQLDVHELTLDERRRYTAAWETAQQHFVDDPRAALAEADQLLARLMGDRGYPAQDFERQVAMVSVDHADVVPEYREAHRTTLMAEREPAETDDMRESMLHYRTLFERLFGEPVGHNGTRRQEER
jgi:hypothetical protein